MKRHNIFIVVLAIFSMIQAAAQGKYAGSMKKLIGVTYTDSRDIKQLAGWTFRQGSVITPLDNPEMITADVFQKGTTWIVYFSVKEDTTDAGSFTIMDVLELKNVQKGWEPKVALCRQNEIENSDIVALVKATHEEFMKEVKMAWRFNKDKRILRQVPIIEIDCLNEGLD